MHIKIAAEPLNDKLPQGQHKALKVETCEKRGDIVNTVKVDNVLCDGKDVIFSVSDGGQLIISTPTAYEEVVYDAAQGAAILKSSQYNDEGRADRHSERVDLKQGQEVDPVTGHDPAKVDPQVSTGSQGQDTRSPAERQGSQANYVPPGGTRVTPGQATQEAAAAEKAAAEKKRQDELQKAQQNAGSGGTQKGT